MANLILLEDERVLREELANFLGKQGHDIDTAGTIADFCRRFDAGRHHLAIIDLGLPDGDGIDLITHIRSLRLNLGIVVLTARGTTRDKVSGLTAGADYYLSKTAEPEELAAVVASLARRLDAGGVSLDWILNSTDKQLIPPGLPGLPLSGQDYAVLKAIIDGAGKPVSKKAIVEALGQRFLDYNLHRLDSQMNRLRRRTLDACGIELPINTLRNQGYEFSAPVRQV